MKILPKFMPPIHIFSYRRGGEQDVHLIVSDYSRPYFAAILCGQTTLGDRGNPLPTIPPQYLLKRLQRITNLIISQEVLKMHITHLMSKFRNSDQSLRVFYDLTYKSGLLSIKCPCLWFNTICKTLRRRFPIVFKKPGKQTALFKQIFCDINFKRLRNSTKIKIFTLCHSILIFH